MSSRDERPQLSILCPPLAPTVTLRGPSVLQNPFSTWARPTPPEPLISLSDLGDPADESHSLLPSVPDEGRQNPGSRDGHSLTSPLEDPRLTPTSLTTRLLRGPRCGLVAHPPAPMSRPSPVAGGQPAGCGSLVATRRKVSLAPHSKPGSSVP